MHWHVPAAATPAVKIWRVALTTRILIAVMAAFMFAFAAIMYSIPLTIGSKDHSADWIIDSAATVMTGFAIFASFALIAVVRTHLTIVNATLVATIVAGHDWLLIPRFRSIRVPLADIASVEKRCEIFRTLGIPATRDAASIVTAGGERIGLFSNTLGSADTLPLDDVTDAIATAAGITVTDDGTVRTHGSGLYGAASSSWTERPLDAATAAKLRRAAILTAQIASALVTLTFVLRACT